MQLVPDVGLDPELPDSQAGALSTYTVWDKPLSLTPAPLLSNARLTFKSRLYHA